MNQDQTLILQRIERYVVEKMNSVDAGHDMSHVRRVLANSKRINEAEQADSFLVEAGVLLHDITDTKLFNKEDAEKELESFLTTIELGKDLIQDLFNIINAVSFGAELDEQRELSLEQKVVRDADRLDAIGAIGIARTFHYGGRKNREVFNADIPPQTYHSTEAYRNSTSPTINHFYEKLLLLKDRMETSMGKVLAEQRHEYMKTFLSQFYSELGEEGFDIDYNK